MVETTSARFAPEDDMAFLAAALGSLALALPQTPAAQETRTVPLLQRVVVLGASFSGGYGLQPDATARTSLADVLHAAILAPHGDVRSATSLLFFTNPDPIGDRLVAQAREAEPTLVVALDYLFWFGYGFQPSDEARLRHLDEGLALLGSIPCPLLVGDLPDMRAASERGAPGAPPPLLAPDQVPSSESLARLNARIREWAAGRKEVVVVPLADLLARLQRDDAIEIRGNVWPRGSRGRLLGPDRLHPTLEGGVGIAIAALDRLASARAEVREGDFDWDAASVVRRVRSTKRR